MEIQKAICIIFSIFKDILFIQDYDSILFFIHMHIEVLDYFFYSAIGDGQMIESEFSYKYNWYR